MRMVDKWDEGKGWPKREKERRGDRGKEGRETTGDGARDKQTSRGGWTRSLWQPWLGFRAPRRRDGLGNVPRALQWISLALLPNGVSQR